MIKRCVPKRIEMHAHYLPFTSDRGMIRPTETRCITSFRKTVTEKTVGKAFFAAGRRHESNKDVTILRRLTPTELMASWYSSQLPFFSLSDQEIAFESVPSFSDFLDLMSETMLKASNQLESIPEVEGGEDFKKTLFASEQFVICPECGVEAECVVVREKFVPYACRKCVSGGAYRCRRKYPFSFPKCVPYRYPSYGRHSHGFMSSGIAGTSLVYTGYGDIFMCRKCYGMIGCWESGDDPIAEHKKHFPDCEDSSPIRCCPNNCIKTNTHFDGKCSCCCTFNICRKECCTFMAQQQFAAVLIDPVKYVAERVALGEMEPAEYHVEYINGMYSVRVDSGHLTGDHCHPDFNTAIREAMRKVVGKWTMPPDPPLFDLPEVEGVLDLPHKTELAVDEVTRASTSAATSLSKIESHVGKFSGQAQAVLDNLNLLVSKISAFFPNSTPTVISFLKDFILGLFFGIMQKSLYPLIQSVVSFSLNNSVFSELAAKLTTWLSSLSYSMDEEDLWHDALEDALEVQGLMDFDLSTFKTKVGSMYAGLGSGVCAAIAGILSFIAILCYGVTDFSTISFNKMLMQSSLLGVLSLVFVILRMFSLAFGIMLITRFVLFCLERLDLSLMLRKFILS